jgi:large subunit ribosomal protein L35
MTMPKIKHKTNRSVAKRIKITARGKLMRNRSGAGHLRSRKTPKRLRRFRRSAQVPRQFERAARRLLGIG